MANTLLKIAFLLEDFGVPCPAQQLLDRFLIGYPRDGEFHQLAGCKLCVWAPPTLDATELDRRVKDFGLVRAPTVEAAVAGADGVVVVPRAASSALVKSALTHASANAAVFVYGVLAEQFDLARQLADLAKSRRIPLVAGAEIAGTWRLPDVEVPLKTPLREGLIVVQGAFPQAELDALDGLLPVLERRKRGESGVRRIRYVQGEDFWRANERGLWSQALFGSAISRSDSPQGDPARDGRTQDIVGLGLLPKLVLEPRGWLLDHTDGLRSALLVLDGAVADYNFAVQTAAGGIVSAQLYRPYAPQQHQFSRLAATLEDYFRTRQPPWPLNRGLLTAGLLAAFGKMRAGGLHELEVPQLAAW